MRRVQSLQRCAVKQALKLYSLCLTLRSLKLVVVDEMSQLFYSCFKTALDRTLQSKIAGGDRAVLEASMVEFENNCALPASCRHVESLDGPCCM